jgi:hypothetical protein
LIDHDYLEAFADPVDYDRQDTSDTGVAFYASLARETGGPVHELALRTGRVAIPIARRVRRDRPGRRPRHAETGARQGRRSARTLDRGRRARSTSTSGSG